MIRFLLKQTKLLHAASLMMRHAEKTAPPSGRSARWVATLIIALLTTATAWGQNIQLSGSGTSDDPYQIYNSDDWMEFSEAIRNYWAVYGDKYFKLMQDVTVTGTYAQGTAIDLRIFGFAGTFDGGNHTLTFNYGGPVDYIAPFAGLESGATIKNLCVAGKLSVSSGKRFAGGIAGWVGNNVTISDCTVSSTITSSGNGAGRHGGLVGDVGSGATLTITRCTFNGCFTGTIMDFCGGFVGNNLGTVNITDALCIPTSLSGEWWFYSFCQAMIGGSSSLTRAYRTFNSSESKRHQGTLVYAEAPDGLVCKKISIYDGSQYWLPGTGDTGAASSYYLHGGSATVTYGVTFDGAALTEGTDYDAVVRNSSNETVGTTLNTTGTYTLTVTLKGDYAGTMTKTFEVKNGLAGSGSSENPYVIDSEPAWNLFANIVNGALGYTQNSFSEKVVKLTQDISGVSMIAGTESHPFSGTFDGGGNTMNLSITNNTLDGDGTAPFGYINGATIKNLTVTGNVMGRTHTAGLVGFSQGTNTIDGCTVNVAVTYGTQAASKHIGGVVGHGLSSTLTIRNTSFGGTLWNKQDYAGGLLGWCDAGCSLTIENCLFKGYYIGTVADHFHPIAIRCDDAAITTSDLGAYYTTPPTLTIGSNIAMSGTRVYSDMPDNEMCQQLTLPDGNDYYIPANITDIETNYAYTGSDITVSYTVKAGNGTTLTEGTDYTVTRSYTTVHDKGGYAITFTGKGSFVGSKTFYFTVGDATPDTPEGLSVDPDIAYPNEGHYYVNMPNKNTTELTFSNSDVNTFRVYDDGGKTGNVQWGTDYKGDGVLKLSAPAGCTFTVSGSVDLCNVSSNTGQYVAAYNGHETTDTQLANVTGSNTLGPVTSTGNTMMIYYHLGYPGSMYNMPGFALTVTINDPNRQYAVNVVAPDNGNLTASSATAKTGATVTLTATPAADYALDQLTVLDAAQQPVAVTSSQFTMPNGPVIVAAKYLPVYTVSFNANGHGTAPDAQPVMQGNMAMEPAAPTAEGYDFGGWYTTAACTGDAYDFTSAVSASTELFAKWTAITYYLNYDLMGGTVATDNPISYTIESSAITLNNPTRDGYTFAGWTGTDITDATESVTIAHGSTGNREYIATWTENTCALTEDDGVTNLISTWQGKQVEVSFTRSGLTADSYSTMCLPFGFTKPDNCTFYAFQGIHYDETESAWVADISVTTTLNAHTPYIFKCTGTEATFSGTISNVAVSYGDTELSTGAVSATAGDDQDWTFKGTYTALDWTTTAPDVPTYGFSTYVPEVASTIAAGTFVRFVKGASLAPFRARLIYSGNDTHLNARTRGADSELPQYIIVRIAGSNGDTTAIGTLDTTTGELTTDGWYALGGRKLSGKPTQKGFYINNGKKVIVR